MRTYVTMSISPFSTNNLHLAKKRRCRRRPSCRMRQSPLHLLITNVNNNNLCALCPIETFFWFSFYVVFMTNKHVTLSLTTLDFYKNKCLCLCVVHFSIRIVTSAKLMPSWRFGWRRHQCKSKLQLGRSS